MSEHISLGGKEFEQIGNSTAEHDDWLAGALSRAGLRPLPKIGEHEQPLDYAERMLVHLQQTGERFRVLGALLIPVGLDSMKWTPKLGLETAEHCRKLGAPADKKKLDNLTLQLLFDFFVEGVASWMSSKSSSETTGGGPGRDQRKTGSASGTPSSVH